MTKTALIAIAMLAASAGAAADSVYPPRSTETLCERPGDVPGACCMIPSDAARQRWGDSYAQAVEHCRENNREAIARQRANGETRRTRNLPARRYILCTDFDPSTCSTWLGVRGATSPEGK